MSGPLTSAEPPDEIEDRPAADRAPRTVTVPRYRLGRGRFAAELGGALLVGAGASAAVQAGVAGLNLSNGTFVPQAVQLVAILIVVVGIAVLAVRDRAGPVALVGTWAGLSALATAPLALMLHGTRFYLGGTTSDQSFRTTYLTRLADDVAPHDFSYRGLAEYYPAGWFWLGGRFAALTGMPAWEAYKPFAIATIAVVASVAYAAWSLLRTRREALGAAVATVLVGVALGATEPYGWAVAAFLPVLAAVTCRVFRAGTGWFGPVCLGLAIGLAALVYTLFAGLAAVIVVVGAVVAVATRRIPVLPALGRLLLAGLPAVVVSLVHWGPYLVQWLGEDRPGGAATRFLPQGSTTLPLPMLVPSALGVLSLIGTVWIVVALRRSDVARGLAILILVCWAWYAASTLALLAGSTLLAFRMEPVVDLAFVVAGVCGIGAAVRAAPTVVTRHAGAVAGVLAVLAAAVPVAALQALPTDTAAYTSYYPDGRTPDGQADPAASGHWTGAVLTALADLTGKPPRDTVLLSTTADPATFAPYYSFQALTPHYANPLGEYAARSAEIARWAKATTPQQLVAALDASPYPPPTAFVLRTAPDGLHLALAEDLFPRSPNVAFSDVVFPASAFAGPLFTTRTVGPFLLAVRR